jgi:long-chain acyl-CoA synthetase
MSTSDPIFAAITAPGSPFEIGERGGMRVFVNAPPDLNMLIEAARRHGEKTCIVEGARRLSFGEVFALRDALVPELGIARGDRVAICMRNRAEWMIGFLAVIKAGGVAALINSRGAAEELVAMVAQVTPVLVLADGERAALMRQGGYDGRILEAESPPPPGEVAAEPTEGDPTEKAAVAAARYRAFHSGPPPPLRGSPPPVGEDIASPDDPAAILFTSGTTGQIKGAILSHRALITGIMSVQLAGLMVLHDTARQHGISVETITANMPQAALLQVYPLFHISGLGAAFLSPFVSGGKIVIMPRWDTDEALRLIALEKVTMLTAVPTMLWDMLNRAKLGEADLSSIRNIGTGGQALPVNLLDAMRVAAPHAVMGTGYGLTETAGSVAMAVGEDFIRNRASAGRVLSLVDMKIDAPAGTPGEIMVRGPMVMSGYWNAPDATAAVLSADGWFRTGDIGIVDDEGYVFIVDRAKDMVISGGENIYCAEVERVLGELPGVSECAAFGMPDERLGEVLVATVVAQGLDAEAIKAAVGERLARYKVPAHVAFSNDTLPRNVMGKVDKKQLRAMWPQLIGEAAHADAN